MPLPTHLVESDYAKLFPAAVDEFPTVINEEHYIDAWIINSAFNSLLVTEQYMLDHTFVPSAPAGDDVIGNDGQFEIPIPAALYTGYETALAWDSDLLEENIMEGVTVFGVLGTLVPGTPAPVYTTMAIAAGSYHTVALMENGDIHAWGLNNYKQANPGSATTPWTDTSTVILSGVKAIAAGYYHTVALMENGDIHAWGLNNYNQANPVSATDPWIRKTWPVLNLSWE